VANGASADEADLVFDIVEFIDVGVESSGIRRAVGESVDNSGPRGDYRGDFRYRADVKTSGVWKVL